MVIIRNKNICYINFQIKKNTHIIAFIEMKSQGVPVNYKLNNIPLLNRYKLRQFRASKINLNIKPVICDQNTQIVLNDNYTPFTINSRQLPQYHKAPLINQFKKIQQTKQMVKQYKIYCEDNKKPNKSHTKMPSISHSNHKIEQIEPSQFIVEQNPKQVKTSFKQRPFRSQGKIKRCSCGKCQQCMKDFAYYLHLCSDQRGLPQITAKSWCIWKQKDDKFYYYYGKRIHKVRQIASLTKIITAMVLLDYSNKYHFDLQRTKFAVRKSSALIGGTTAKLNVGQAYTLKQLLYGMMLPSGNDAAIAISEAISLMINLKTKNKSFDPNQQNWYQQYQNKNYSYLFIASMNQKVQRLGTIDTKFYNSHGNDAYDQLKNISTCNQIAKISAQFMKYPLLREVVKKPQFVFKNGNIVQNTNKLLEDGFQGIKTGITQTAGPCLAACYKDLVVVVLNSKSMNQRWLQVKKLIKWIKNRI